MAAMTGRSKNEAAGSLPEPCLVDMLRVEVFPDLLVENLNEPESLHHRANLNQIGSQKGGPEDEVNDERAAISDCSDAREISESRQKTETPNPRRMLSADRL
jgi:hypothetical protein